MIARYSGTCPLCNRAIVAGHEVHWRKGTAARHVNCGAPFPTARVGARRENTDDGYDRARDEWLVEGGMGRMPAWWAARYGR